MRADVLVGELAAHERSGPVAAGQPLHPLERRQVEPLLVSLFRVGEGEQCYARQIERLLEDDQRLLAVALQLQPADAHLAAALAAVAASQHHGQVRAVVAVAADAPVGFHGDGAAPVFSGLCRSREGAHHQDRASGQPERPPARRPASQIYVHLKNPP